LEVESKSLKTEAEQHKTSAKLKLKAANDKVALLRSELRTAKEEDNQDKKNAGEAEQKLNNAHEENQASKVCHFYSYSSGRYIHFCRVQ